MPALSVGGLVSGLDTNSIISQLTALEQQKVTRELQKKDNVQKTLDQFKELQTRLGNLAAKASAMGTIGKFSLFKSTSNYEDYVTVSGKEGAIPDKYKIKVGQLAESQKVASKAFSSIVTPLGVDTTLKISLSAAAQKNEFFRTDVEVKISASDTLKDIASKINAAAGAGVKASIQNTNGENRLILTAVDTGTNTFTISETGGTDLLGSVLGILGTNSNFQKAISGSALLALDGTAVNEENKYEIRFNNLNTVLNTNELTKDDVVGIFLPSNNGSGSAGWKTYGILEGYDSNNKPIYKTIGDLLDEINGDLESANASFTAKLGNSGEIVLEGNLNADGNFDEDNLDKVKIQIFSFNTVTIAGSPHTFTEADLNNSTYTEEERKAMINVKKDMGTFGNVQVFSNTLNEGQNAVYSVDGRSVSSKSNNDETFAPGTVFELKKVTKDIDSVNVSLDLDIEGVANKIKEFVEEFNALMKFIDENAKAVIKEQTDANGKRTNTRITGPFTGEAIISSLRESVRGIFTNSVSGLSGSGSNSTVYSSLARLGIVTTREGTLEVDSEKLEKALNADFEGVSRLFTANNFSSEPGFSIGRYTKDSKAGVYETDGHDVWFTDAQGNKEKLKGVTGVPDGTLLTTADGLSIEIPQGFFANPANAGKTVSVTFVRGVADQLSSYVEKAKALTVTRSDGTIVPGQFRQSEEMYTKRIEELEKRAYQLQIRVDNYNMRLIKQYSALEKSMGNLQSQSANMMSALSALSTNYSGNNNR